MLNTVNVLMGTCEHRCPILPLLVLTLPTADRSLLVNDAWPSLLFFLSVCLCFFHSGWCNWMDYDNSAPSGEPCIWNKSKMSQKKIGFLADFQCCTWSLFFIFFILSFVNNKYVALLDLLVVRNILTNYILGISDNTGLI